MSPGDSNGGPLVRDRRIAENAAAKQVPVESNTASTDIDSHVAQVRGCLVLVVETPGGKYRRRTFLTLAAAERACKNARDAGHPASVMVARLEPVAVAP